MQGSKGIFVAIIFFLILGALGFGAYYLYGKKTGGGETNTSTTVTGTETSISEENTGRISGTVTYRERIALPVGSMVEVELRDMSRADAQGTTVGHQRITTEGENVPLSFVLSYDASSIDPSHTYVLFARITVDGTIRWVTTEQYPVLTYENAMDNVAILLRAVESADSADAMELDRLNGSTFRLTSYNGATLPSGETYTLSFEDNRLNAKFCNTMSGEAVVDNGMLSSVLASTLMLCVTPANIMTLEQEFSTMLADGAVITHEGSRLILTQGEKRMIFEKQ